MFYLRKSDPADKQFFEQALQRFRHMFSRMIALDNVILFDRNLGYQKDPDFARAFRNAAQTAQDGTSNCASTPSPGRARIRCTWPAILSNAAFSTASAQRFWPI